MGINRKCKIRDRGVKILRVATSTIHEQNNSKERKGRKSQRVFFFSFNSVFNGGARTAQEEKRNIQL